MVDLKTKPVTERHDPAPISRLGNAVVCKAVRKEFGDGDSKVVALANINVTIRYGELTLLVGPSGCGKTTLISLIAGLLNPTAGDIELLGNNRQNLTGSKLVKFRAKNVGFVFQQYNLIPSLTAAENAAVPLLIAGVRRDRAVAAAAKVLEEVGLGHRLNAKSTQLSGGQQQRVAIARALVHQPRLLVCDEPTAALDAQSGRTVMQLLRQVAVHPERAVIVVTHDSRVYDFGDRLLEMSDGNIVTDVSRDDGSFEEFLASHRG